MARILHVIPAFLPATAWGGPVVSTAAICRAAVEAGHEIDVVTTDSAAPDRPTRLAMPAPHMTELAGYGVTYAPRQLGQSLSLPLLAALPGRIAKADLVHLSMTYSFPTLPTLLLCRLIGRPVIWSPRGAIEATEVWAEAPKRRLKAGFERLARWIMPRQTRVHVTAQAEAEATGRRLPGAAMSIIPNAVPVPDSPPSRHFRLNGRLRLLFLGRLHPKKGIEDLLHALAGLPPDTSLTLAGRGSDTYEARLRAVIAELGLTDRVIWRGHVEGRAKAQAFAEADLFVLPTKSENFGIAIAEALASGLPVITTQAAPWEGMVTTGSGLWIAPTRAALTDALALMRARPAAQFATMGAKGHAWMQDAFSPASVDHQMMALYDEMLRGPA